MKGGSVHKLRVKNFSLSLIILLCLTIVFWAWEKTHVLTPFLPPTDQFDVSSSMLSAGLPPCMLLVLLIFLSFLRFLAVSNFPFFLFLTFVHRAFCQNSTSDSFGTQKSGTIHSGSPIRSIRRAHPVRSIYRENPDTTSKRKIFS